MRNYLFAGLSAGVLLFSVACDEDDTNQNPDPTFGTFEIEFDNVFGDGADQTQLSLNEVGDTDYPYTNAMGQNFNLTFLRYFVSDVVLHGNGVEDYVVPVEVGVDVSTGFFLVKEEDASSQLVRLFDVPTGDYNAISFTIGIDSTNVQEGAAGGILDPVVNKMFWSWNAGYVAVKLEGQSPAAPGQAFGNTIDTSVTDGFVYHIGGWKEIAGSPLVYNNRRVRLEFFDDAKVTTSAIPHAHLEFDVSKLLGASTPVDFSGNNNVHSPSDSRVLGLVDNMEAAFRFDHLHQ